MNHELFEKNIQSLNPSFQQILKKSQKHHYQIIQGNDPLDINIKDEWGGVFYENPILELNNMLTKYNQMYKLYPVLYFYGFGNGILYKALLQNPNIKHIVVFEKNLSLIQFLFYHIDFSKELQEGRLIITQDNINTPMLLSLISKNPFREFIRTYFLEIHCKYYEKFQTDILNLNSVFLSCIKSIATIKGTDAKDTLQGIDQFLKNIPDMLSRPSFKEFINKRKQIQSNAIIVSTGPSLTKQLHLLKQYQNNAVIFCADSAYSILYEKGIKPDYVFMVERGEVTAEFFHNDFGDFDKNTTFILTSLVHPNAIKYLKQNNRQFVLISKETFEYYFALHSFGYVDLALSVAHLAFIIINLLKFENIIFIGQDLAYNNLGESHPKNYKYSANYESNLEKIQVLAYGGKSKVYTHIAWDTFRVNLEYLITQSKAKIYNATEGGARIEGATEESFEKLCKLLLSTPIDKNFIKLKQFPYYKKQEYLLKTYYKILTLQNDIYYYIDKYTKQLTFIAENHNDFEKVMFYLENLDLDDFEKNHAIKILLACFLDQLRFALAKIYVIIPTDEYTRMEKIKAWIFSHFEYFKLVITTLENLKYIIDKHQSLLNDILLENNLEKYKNLSQIKGKP
ncbi:motility associated factor glycosyltransferase family protein [Campylobacter sp. 2014D-0216]|uniref:motility associated factor glycosyltransferase family protein n=1 Tax=Campylobacter sp. 2014D-0216 TaxID=1813595 RepID=UPI0018A5E6B1|nr:6-hydroxymethylpterin diphosphokinase MptE-like protein [Campylobacter sp. 2014D-0216]QOR01347.1 motility associated factor glycosyltransferase family protein [Campylobacter sp. 2014D-0216]